MLIPSVVSQSLPVIQSLWPSRPPVQPAVLLWLQTSQRANPLLIPSVARPARFKSSMLSGSLRILAPIVHWFHLPTLVPSHSPMLMLPLQVARLVSLARRLLILNRATKSLPMLRLTAAAKWPSRILVNFMINSCLCWYEFGFGAEYTRARGQCLRVEWYSTAVAHGTYADDLYWKPFISSSPAQQTSFRWKVKVLVYQYIIERGEIQYTGVIKQNINPRDSRYVSAKTKKRKKTLYILCLDNRIVERVLSSIVTTGL